MGEGEGREENGLAVAELADHNQRFYRLRWSPIQSGLVSCV
jgi:hypothetical protein